MMPWPRRQFFNQIPFTLLLLGSLTAPATGAGNTSGKTVVHPSRDADAYILSHRHAFFGTNASIKDVESLTKKVDGDFLWVRRAGKEFVIRDTGTIEEAQRLFQPLSQLDPEREALQGKQERLGSIQAALNDDEGKLEHELEALDDQGRHHDSDSVRTALKHRRTDLKSKMRALEARERELDADESLLESRSDMLEQKAETALWSLVDQALTNGLGRAIGRE